FAADFGHLTFPLSIDALPATATTTQLECFDDTGAEMPGDGGDETDIPAFIPTPEGYNCEELNPVEGAEGGAPLQVRWRVNDDQTELEVELIGMLPEGEYFAFGVSGSNERTEMIGADVQIADMFNGAPRVRDFFMDSRAQCSGVAGVCRDDAAGFTDDILSVGGEVDEESGVTIIRYKKPLSPTDLGSTTNAGVAVDQGLSIAAGVSTFIAWAIGPVSPDTGNALFHATAFERGDMAIEFGRTAADNCPLLYDGTGVGPTEPPAEPWDIPRIPDTVTEITAHIGPSGGPRGYASITGNSPWGIAWFLNGDLIPEMVMRRGTTYTFKVNGGTDPEADSLYHPFYLTTSERGGYQQLSPADRLNETPLAGIDISQQSDSGVFGFEATAIAPICSYQVTGTSGEAMLGSYDGWVSTLDMSCAEDESIISQAAEISFTPDENTPDTIYYHCVTHFDLGWKISVIDADGTSPPTNGADNDIEVGELTAVELEGFLDGSTFSYVINSADERANGQDTLTIVYEAPVDAWVAVAFSTDGRMPGSEAVIGLPDEGTVQKYFLSERNLAGVQLMENQSLIDTSIVQEGGMTTLTFTKILVEANEIPVVVGVNTFLGAWGIANPLATHGARESFQVDLVSGGAQELQTREISLWRAHGWCAGIAWGLLSPLAIGVAILRKWFNKPAGLWFKIHQTLNTLVVVLTIAAFGLAVAAINKETPDGFKADHFNPDPFPHRAVGLVIFILALLQVGAGIFRPHTPEEGEEKTSIRTGWEYGHKIVGYSLLGMALYQVQSGIKIYGEIDMTDVNYLAIFWGVAAGILGATALGFISMKLFDRDDPSVEGSKTSKQEEHPDPEQ
ncbi:MAG: hypothetical protein SGILL_006840, partial [Bacillariaceae sp.]